MTRQRFSALIRDVLSIEIGLMISSLGTALFYLGDLGSGAMATFSDGLHRVLPLTYGQANLAANIVLLIVLFILDRRYINIGTVLCVFTIGPWVDLFGGLLSGIDGHALSMATRVLLGVAGCALMGLGLGMYVAVDRGFGALEGIVKLACSRWSVSMSTAKIVQDAVLVVLGIALGASWGIGTVIAIALIGPILQASCRAFGALFRRMNEGLAEAGFISH